MRLRPLYAELRKPANRLRKHGETKADGTFIATDRLGPLTMDARRYGLAEILSIQSDIQGAAFRHGLKNAEDYTLIDTEEHERILELIAANTWPNRWTGTEDQGDLIRPVRFTKGGGRQMQMMLEEATEV
jgi:DNA sulfur modification protein DndC